MQQIATRGEILEIGHVQLAAIAILASGGTTIEAAEVAGVNRSTIWRWQKTDPVFIAALNAAFRDRQESLAREHHDLAGRALTTLGELMAPDAPPAIRLRAAVATLQVVGGPPQPPAAGPVEPEAVAAQLRSEEVFARLLNPGWAAPP